MTLGEIISRVDALKPNAYPSLSKILWLSEVEGMIQSKILLLSAEDSVLYDGETPLSRQTVLGDDAVGIYTAYLIAMIDFFNGEFERYNNSIAIFNNRFSDCMRTHAALTSDQRTPFVLSAYAIACKYGFCGTEEDWVKSLRHDPITVTEASSPITVEDGVSYRLEGVSDLEIICPGGEYACHFLIKTADSGAVSVNVTGATSSDEGYLAADNGEIWEISIINGLVASHLWEVRS